MQDKKIELQEQETLYQQKLDEQKKVQALCKKRIEQVKRKLENEKLKAEANLEELKKDDTSTNLSLEDEYAQTLRVDDRLAREMAKFNRLNSLAVEQKLMVAEDFELSKQLAMSKPLVSGMLEFLASKSNTKQSNEAL